METLECVVGQVDGQVAWDPIYRWFLKWKQSCGTEALSCQVFVDSGQLVSELNRIVGHLVGVRELENQLLMEKGHSRGSLCCLEDSMKGTNNRRNREPNQKPSAVIEGRHSSRYGDMFVLWTSYEGKANIIC